MGQPALRLVDDQKPGLRNGGLPKDAFRISPDMIAEGHPRYLRVASLAAEEGIPAEHANSILWALANGNKNLAAQFLEAGHRAQAQLDNVPVFCSDYDLDGWK